MSNRPDRLQPIGPRLLEILDGSMHEVSDTYATYAQVRRMILLRRCNASQGQHFVPLCHWDLLLKHFP